MNRNLQFRGSSLICVFVVLVLTSVFSCSSHGSDSLTGPPEYNVWYRIFLPYVEGVELPETITANESFRITVRLSATLKPEILKVYGVKKPVINVYSWTEDTRVLWSNLAVFLNDIPSSGDQVEQLVLEIPPLEEGNYTLVLASADSIEWGGLDISYNMGSGRLMYPENESHRTTVENAITVLPADDDEGEGA